MRSRVRHKLSSALVTAFAILIGATAALAQGSTFTYQGRLTDGGTAANGNYDLQFALWDSASGGTQIGSTQTLSTVPISTGVFTVSLDFGASSFNGTNRFLEIGARPSGVGSFTLLSPRQQVTATPYAIRSVSASSADSAFTATNATQLGGVAANQYVQTNDSRLSDARTPTAGSSNYIQNTTSQQASASFNISGNGVVGGTFSGNIINAGTQYNIGGNRVLSVAGTLNLFAGPSAGLNNTGAANSFFGNGAGSANTSGTANSFFGQAAGSGNTSGSSNSFFGEQAGAGNKDGYLNAFFGGGAGSNHISGYENSFFGVGSGTNDVNGSQNTLVGRGANVGADSLTNATAIGVRALVAQNNSLVLGSINNVNGATADTNVGIGTTAPRSALEVVKDWNGSFGALTLTGDRPTIRFSSNNSVTGNNQWILHLGSAAGPAPIGSLSFFYGGTAGTGYGSPILSVTPAGSVIVTNLGFAGSTQLCRNSSSEISTCSSSLRYKTNVASFSGGLDIINRLRPISFEWKQNHLRDIGLGAEEVEQVEPLLTFRNDKGEIEGVKYNQLSTVFINAFKEQQAEIQQQQKQLKRQEEKIARERAANAAQQEQLNALRALVCRSHRRASVCR